MSQKEIRLFDDSVIKLTVKQGLESERYPISATNREGSGVTYEGASVDILNFDQISTLTGSFTTGELAYTRDTNRLFIGNLSESLKDNQQQTLGGVLTGNKYLGYVDSRDGARLKETTPLSLADNLLLEESDYRSYEFIDTNNEIKKTEDGKWSRLSYYNDKYDAYDGDIMYDVYRNALILFDHNIKAWDETWTSNKKQKTPLQARFEGQDGIQDTPEKYLIYEHTKNMYGDGYVLLYNVIPDGTTLTFEPRELDAESTNKTPNFSHNVIRINKVPTSAIVDTLDEIYFTTNSSNKISLDENKIKELAAGSSINIAVPNQEFILKNDTSGIVTQTTITVSDLNNCINRFEDIETLEARVSDAESEIEALSNRLDNINNSSSEDDSDASVNYRN